VRLSEAEPTKVIDFFGYQSAEARMQLTSYWSSILGPILPRFRDIFAEKSDPTLIPSDFWGVPLG